MLEVEKKMLEFSARDQVRKLNRQIELAKQELRKNDYIGRKIAEALLMQNDVKLAELRTQYAAEIENADLLRQKINEWQAELDALSTK